MMRLIRNEKSHPVENQTFDIDLNGKRGPKISMKSVMSNKMLKIRYDCTILFVVVRRGRNSYFLRVNGQKLPKN